MKNLLFASMAIVFAACTSENGMFDENATELDTKKNYATHFVQKYPNVNLNQSWDYSTKANSYRLLGNTTKAMTRAGKGTITTGEWYDVELETNKWMQTQLVEEQNNKDKGTPFYMTVPSNHFSIIPVFVGASGAFYELHVVIGDNDYTIWEKHQDIEMKDVNNQTWHSTKRDNNFNNEWKNCTVDKHNNGEVTAIRSKQIEFNGFTAGEAMHFYLKITKQSVTAGYHTTGTEQSSLNHMMIALDNVPRPSNIASNKEVALIGCEDADLSKSDWDYNDVVFLIVGDPDKPKTVPLEETITETKTVRYMIEDLGSVDDFDFNDIVVDVSDVTEKKAKYNADNTFAGWDVVDHYQKAILRHLGGTLPFKLTIGDTALEEMGGNDTFKTDPNKEFDVSGWDINSHNISVEVKQMQNSTVYNKVKFPKSGEVPMVIAVDATQNWMPERQSVPETWFYVED